MALREELLLPWGSQPQEAVELQPEIAPHLSVLALGSRREFLGCGAVTEAGGITRAATQAGIAWQGDGSDNIAYAAPVRDGSILATGTHRFTLLTVFRKRAVGASQGHIVGYGSTTGGPGNTLHRLVGGSNADQIQLQVQASGGGLPYNTASSSAGINDQGWHCAVVPYQITPTLGDDAAAYWIDGFARGSVSREVGAADTTFNLASVGATVRVGTVSPCNWDVALYVHLLARMPDEWCQRASRLGEVWDAVFAPRRIWVPQSAGGGDTQTESGGAGASVAASAVGAGTAAEQASGGASAGVSVSAVGTGTATEAASGGASAGVTVSAAGAGTASEAGAESGGASATVTVSASGAGTAAEAASGGAGAVVAVSAAGAGAASEEGAQSGGASAAVLVTASGAGLALEIAVGGASATVSVSAAGAGEVPAEPTIGRPASDTSNTGWTASTGSDLYAMLDEETPDAADYIVATSVGAVCELALNATAYPGTASQVLKFRASSSTGNGVIVRLKNTGGATVRSQAQPLTPVDTEYSLVLTAGEIAAITSGALSVELESA